MARRASDSCAGARALLGLLGDDQERVSAAELNPIQPNTTIRLLIWSTPFVALAIFIALQFILDSGAIELLLPVGLGFLAGWLGRKLLHDSSLPLIATTVSCCVVAACFVAPEPHLGSDETTKKVFYGTLELLLFAGGALGFLFSQRTWVALLLSALFGALAFAAFFMVGVTVGCAWFGDCL